MSSKRFAILLELPYLMPETPPDDQSTPVLTGRTLGNYRLLHRLGRGGMAEVYLAEQPSLQRQVAIKILRPDLAEQGDYVKRFQNEARAVAALVHANIVQIYEVGHDHGVHFIAQEYVPGQNVKQLVTRHGPLEIERTVSILRQIAAALHRAGQRNIVHRDIKPENILLNPSGEAKVADFGLARVTDPQNVDLTQAGLTMGTPLYMSPEQVEGKPLDHRSDLYACGVTAFYMLVGRPPFEGDTPLSVAIKHLQSPPPDLAKLRPDAPTELVTIVQRLLAKKPSERYATAADLLRDLRALPIVGWHDEWPVEDETLATTAVNSAPSQLEATRALQTLMSTQAMAKVGVRKRWHLPVIILGGLAVGTLVALLTWSGPLLSVTNADLKRIEEQPNARLQYFYAFQFNNEDAWKSVAEYFPESESVENKHYARLADTQLAWLYVQQERYDEALEIYRQLANLEPIEKEMRAIGFAGQVIVHDRKNDLSSAKELLSSAMAHSRELNQTLEDELNAVAKRIENPGT